jgi:hypothetical protein
MSLRIARRYCSGLFKPEVFASRRFFLGHRRYFGCNASKMMIGFKAMSARGTGGTPHRSAVRRPYLPHFTLGFIGKQ